MKATLPKDEEQRLEVLRRYRVLDTPPEQELDDITLLAAHLCDAPTALITLVDADRQWFKSKVGWVQSETSREVSFCAHAILDPEGELIVPDASRDARFVDNPLVTADPPHIRFYAGVPLVTADGYALGALCVIDREARVLSAKQLSALRALRRSVVVELELRSKRAELRQAMDTIAALTGTLEKRVAERTKTVRESEEDHRRVVEVSPDAIYVVQDNKIVFANESALRMFGAQSQAGLLGRSVFELTHPKFRRLSEERIQALHSGASSNPLVEQVFLRLDGAPINVEVASVRMSYGGGPAIQVIARDVTERMKNEEDLRRFRAAMDVSGDAIFLVDRKSMQYLDVNQTFCEMVGYSRQELIGMRPTALFGIDGQALEREYDGIINGSGANTIEAQYRHKNGSRIPIESRRRPLRTDAGWIIVGNARDIRERKAAEAKLSRVSRVQALLSAINAAIVRIRDRDALFVEACRIAVETGGYRMAWVGLVRHDAAHSVEPVSTAGDDRGYFVGTRLSWDDNEFGRGPTGFAVRTGQPQIAQDIRNAEGFAPWRDRALVRGYESAATLPLIFGNHTSGVFGLFSETPNAFDEEEVALLRELAGDIAFALDHIEKADRIDYLAYYDSLTGLANRSLFLERLAQSAHAAHQNRGKLALVLADVERFKMINDSLGRHAGDSLLKQIAQRLVRAVNPADIARIGGDHFAIILPAIKGKSEVGRKIEGIWRDHFAQPFQVDPTSSLRISVKAGVAMFPNDAAGADKLLAHAEAALRKAKRIGELYQFYSGDLTIGVSEQLALENKLRHALDNDEFLLHYQAKVDHATRRIVGVEALIRWRSPELGLVLPEQFIPLMEETGLILDVGAWALAKAASDHARWVGLGAHAPRVAVNVSASQLRRRDFVSTVEQALLSGTIHAGLDLEITESLVMQDIEDNIDKLKTLRNLGVNVAIDDFGTGYSSLGYLVRLPVQTVKIDRSFIVTMLKEPDTMTLVESIVSLAHSLRLEVVAEGVDTEEQATVLTRLHCDQMQGYLFYRPIPFDEMTTVLSSAA